MTRRDMTFQGLLALGLVVGIVGGNFALHRWMFGNVTSRDAAADTVPATTDDEPVFVPRRATTPSGTAQPTAAHREQLRKLIETHLPNATADEAEAWLEELQDLPLPTAEGILNLRQQNGPLTAIPSLNKMLETTEPEDPAARTYSFSLSLSR